MVDWNKGTMIGDAFGIAGGALSAQKSGNLAQYGLNKMGELNKDNPFGEIFKVAGGAVAADKTGTLGQYGRNQAKGILDSLANSHPFGLNAGINSTGLTNIPKNSLLGSLSGIGSMLSPDYDGKNKIDGAISNTNKQYAEYKNAPPVVDTSSAVTQVPSAQKSSIGAGSNGGTSSGLGAAMVTRNPDSIFREVSIAVMKATIT